MEAVKLDKFGFRTNLYDKHNIRIEPYWTGFFSIISPIFITYQIYVSDTLYEL